MTSTPASAPHLEPSCAGSPPQPDVRPETQEADPGLLLMTADPEPFPDPRSGERWLLSGLFGAALKTVGADAALLGRAGSAVRVQAPFAAGSVSGLALRGVG